MPESPDPKKKGLPENDRDLRLKRALRENLARRKQVKPVENEDAMTRRKSPVKAKAGISKPTGGEEG